MSDALEILAVGFAAAMVFSLPFIFVAFLRYLRYRERIALAEQGIAPRSAARSEGTSSLLRWGIIFFSIGLALSCSAVTGLLMFFITSDSGGPAIVLLVVPVMFLVLLPLFFGIALIVINRLNNRTAESDTEPVPPGKMG